MNVTISNDCTYFTVADTSIVGGTDSASLVITHNCTTSYPAVTINIGTFMGTETFTVTPATIGLTAFPEGPFTFVLTVVDTTTVVETACALNLCNLQCSISSAIIDKDIDKVLTLEALKASSSCVSCGCSLACDLYASLTETPINVVSCGCQ